MLLPVLSLLCTLLLLWYSQLQYTAEILQSGTKHDHLHNALKTKKSKQEIQSLAAVVIQTHWKSFVLYRKILRQKAQKLEMTRQIKATKIQTRYRMKLATGKVEALRQYRIAVITAKAAVRLQVSSFTITMGRLIS